MSLDRRRAACLWALVTAPGIFALAYIFQAWLTPALTLALLDGAFMCS